MNEEIRSLFPAANYYTYLNSAAVSPMPVTAVDAVTSQLEDVSAHGSQHYESWIATKNRARDLLAGMMCVRSDQVAFTRNTSDGFATIAAGLKWQKGDNIVTFEREFPSNFYPWRRIRDDFAENVPAICGSIVDGAMRMAGSFVVSPRWHTSARASRSAPGNRGARRD